MIYKLKTLPLISLLWYLVSCQEPTKEQKTENTQTKPTMTIEKTPFGKYNDQEVFLFTLKNKLGTEIKITNYGGIITHWLTADKKGEKADIVLGFDSLDEYVKNNPYFGCIIGRYGNRIAKGKFNLEGKTYQLATNNDLNHLHGGVKGFDKVIWQAEILGGDEPALKLSYTSPDGEEAYPGNLQTKVTYTLKDDNSLVIDYEAVTDKATIINLTNHSYFNLSGDKQNNILKHNLQINAEKYLPVDKTLIPLQITAVKNTPFDLTKPIKLGEKIKAEDEQLKIAGGFDHCWVLNQPQKDSLFLAAILSEETSGRKLEVWTTEPAIQFYSGNFLNGSVKGKGKTYSHRYGLCLETQHYPDSPNRPDFPSTQLLPGQTYKSKTIYKATIAE
jgi:aldose 1-epimerase